MHRTQLGSLGVPHPGVDWGGGGSREHGVGDAPGPLLVHLMAATLLPGAPRLGGGKAGGVRVPGTYRNTHIHIHTHIPPPYSCTP